MGPDFWTGFVFFGMPLVVGLLGSLTGGRLCYRAYRQYTTAEALGPGAENADRDWRGNLVRGLPLLVGAGLLALHSGRWLVRIL